MIWICVAATTVFGSISAALYPYELTPRGELVMTVSAGLTFAFFFGVLMELAW